MTAEIALTLAVLLATVLLFVGAGLFAAVYGRIEKTVLAKGDLKEMTLPGLLKVGTWAAVLPAAALIVLVLWLLERAGL
jgi:hypothetical protein